MDQASLVLMRVVLVRRICRCRMVWQGVSSIDQNTQELDNGLINIDNCESNPNPFALYTFFSTSDRRFIGIEHHREFRR